MEQDIPKTEKSELSYLPAKTKNKFGHDMTLKFFSDCGWSVKKIGKIIIAAKDDKKYAIRVKCGNPNEIKHVVASRSNGIIPAIFYITDRGEFAFFVWNDDICPSQMKK